MAAFICFLRGVNVGGKGKVPMADLRALFEDHGCKSVKTVLQSGNVVFSATGSGATLARKLEAAIEETFRCKSEIQVLTLPELRCIVDDNPFPAEARKDPSHLLVHFLPKAPAKDASAKMTTLAAPGERLALTSAAAYVFYAHGIASSKLAGGIDRALGVRGTGRNWNTVTKMLALAEVL
jgi:uncharacterized protein (DUF1697 family)